MPKHRGSGPFPGRLRALGLAGLLLAGLSVALVAWAQPTALTVDKTALPDAVEPGELVIYTVTLNNTGQDDITLESIADTLPEGFSFAGMQTGPQPSSTAGPIVWTGLDDLAGGASFQLAYYVLVDATWPDVYTNEVAVSTGSGEPVSASADVTVLGAILDGSKTGSVSEVKVGETLDYTVVINNGGTSPAALTSIIDTLPAQFEYVAMLAGPTPTVQGDDLVWNGLEVGPAASLELRYRVRAYGAVGSVQTNRVQVSSPDGSLPEMSWSVTLRERVFWAYLPAIARFKPPEPVTPYRLAFERQEVGNYEIYAVNADGTNLLDVSNMAGGDTTPQFSPDGTKVAWVHFFDSIGDIVLANADGTGLTNVSSHAKEDRGPSWSPDGTKIAFHSYREEDRWEVYTVNIDGSNVQRLTDHLCQSHDPQWSPDGTKIAYICGLDSYAEVYVMNADGSNPQRLTEDDTSVYNEDAALNWSPDSTRLAYVKFAKDNHTKGNIYTVNVSTKQIVQVTDKDTASYAPAWSPDGTRIAFSTYIDGSYDIVTTNPDGSNLVNLTYAPKMDNLPRWSSDGVKIAFVSNRASDTGSVYSVYVMNADGSGVARVTADTVSESNPNWRP